MDIAFCTLDDVARCEGTVVVIDVLRAFTTAAEGLAAGVASWELVATTEQALQRREQDPSTVVVGEVDGHVAAGFDHGNSPTLLPTDDLAGRPVVHRSSSGTQGVVRAVRADRVLATSFAVATATARCLVGDTEIWFCVTGAHSGRDGDEDRACGDFIAALLAAGVPVDPAPFVARVAGATVARLFRTGDPDMPIADLEFAQVVDRHDFAMQVDRACDRHMLETIEVQARQ